VRSFFRVFIAVFLFLALVVVMWPEGTRSTPDRPDRILTAYTPTPSVSFDLEVYNTQVAIWVEGVQKWEAEQAWYAGVQTERDRQIAPVSTGSSSYHPGTTTGDCTGFAIPDYIIQRESGGNSSAYNPSGAYGCAQTLLSHYSRGSCQGLDPYAIEGQRECVWILSGGGTNLQPWAATR